MWTFGYAAIAYAGLGLIALPVIIHLINLMRHRRVEWAAMEFLLESQRKNSAYVMLKQLLLLFMRMAALAALAMILGELLLRYDLLPIGPTHHIVVLEDSFSTSDRGSDQTSAFDRGKKVVGEIAKRAQERTQQKFTLLRTSTNKPDLSSATVGVAFSKQLDPILRDLHPSELARGPEEALTSVLDGLGDARGEKRIIYLVSDFRSSDWHQPAKLVESLKTLSKDQAQIVLINTVDRSRPNLAVTALRPVVATRAAGVPTTLEVTVQNFGTEPAQKVSVQIEEDGEVRPERENIGTIAPGKSETRRFEVLFPTAGEHVLTARLDTDSVEADNVRYLTLDFPIAVPVLLIDGDASGSEASVVADALAPGGSVNTGLAPQIEQISFLANKDLTPFRTLFLFNVQFLDQTSIKNLEAYTKAGGGVCFFFGDKTNAGFVNNNLYRLGEGIVPCPLGAPADLLLESVEKVSDLRSTENTIFDASKNAFLNFVSVKRYFAVQPGWGPSAKSEVSVICRLRNNAPFAIESRFGEGRVLTILTSAGTEWNTWRANPSFPVAMLEAQTFLSGTGIHDETRTVGAPLDVAFNHGEYNEQVQLIAPGQGAVSATQDAKVEKGQASVSFPADKAGVYTVQLNKPDGESDVRRYAYNVVAEEGNLQVVPREELEQHLTGVKYEFQQSDRFQEVPGQTPEQNFSEMFLYLLIVILMLEQILAYFLSYHPTGKGAVR